MLFILSDPDLVIPSALDRELRDCGHEVRRDAEAGASGVGTDAALILGETDDLAARVKGARAQDDEVIIVTLRKARDSAKTAALLNLGADDDVVWPVPLRELVARVEAARRLHARDRRDAIVSFGVTVFPDDRVPEVGGAPLPLSALEGRVLSRLLRSPGRTVTREALYRSLYAYSEQSPSERVVDVHVCHLRRKIRDALGEAAPVIRTIRGVGYLAAPP